MLVRAALSKLGLMRPGVPRTRTVRGKTRTTKRPRWPRREDLQERLRKRSYKTFETKTASEDEYRRAKLPSGLYLATCRKLNTNLLARSKLISPGTNRLLVTGYLLCKHISKEAAHLYARRVWWWTERYWNYLNRGYKTRFSIRFEGRIRGWLGKALPFPLGPFMALKYADFLQVMRQFAGSECVVRRESFPEALYLDFQVIPFMKHKWNDSLTR
jgi:hypothetical protein